MIYDILKKKETPNKYNRNEKEVKPWEKECLSLQSERQGIGGYSLGLQHMIERQ